MSWTLSERKGLCLFHIGVDPVEEVSDFGKDTRLALAGSGSPGNHADDVELSGLGFGGTDEGAAGVAHASRLTVRAEPDHAGPDHAAPTGLQVGVLPDFALELLESVGHLSGRSDQTPAGKPASFGTVVVIAGIGHASCASVGSREVDVLGQLDQSDVVFDLVRSVEIRVHDDPGNLDIFFGSVIVLLMPFSDADAEFGGRFGASEAVSGAKNPPRGDQSTSANVLSLEKGVGRESEGDLPGEFSVAGGKSVDDFAAGALLAAGLEGGGARHNGRQHDQELHLLLRCLCR